jgi:hypothetical protein
MPSRTRTTEPARPADAFDASDGVYAHSSEQAAAYRGAAQEAARRRQVLGGTYAAPAGPAAPDEAPLPPIGVARQRAGAEIRRLREQAAGLERWLSRAPFGAAGVPVPGATERQQQARQQIEEIQARIADLDGLDDHQTQLWAAGRQQDARGMHRG